MNSTSFPILLSIRMLWLKSENKKKLFSLITFSVCDEVQCQYFCALVEVKELTLVMVQCSLLIVAWIELLQFHRLNSTSHGLKIIDEQNLFRIFENLSFKNYSIFKGKNIFETNLSKSEKKFSWLSFTKLLNMIIKSKL